MRERGGYFKYTVRGPITNTHIYIYMYIYICVCVCVCVCIINLWSVKIFL